MSFAPALLISSRSAWEKQDEHPHDALITRRLTPACLAETPQSIAEIAPSTVPEREASRNFRAISETDQFTPATPTPLLPTAPMIPATCEPLPLSPFGSQ